MVRSLSSIVARIERLASRIRQYSRPVGCSECRGRKETTRIICVYGNERPDIPPQSRCETCGRVILPQFVTVVYDPRMKPPEEPTSWESLKDESKNPKSLT
jgi:hypothetical protein